MAPKIKVQTFVVSFLEVIYFSFFLAG